MPTSESVTTSAGLWLMPPAQRTNSIAIGAIAQTGHAVMARARRQMMDGKALRTNRSGELLLQERRAGRSARVPHRRGRDRDTAARGDGVELHAHRRHGLLPRFVARSARIE